MLMKRKPVQSSGNTGIVNIEKLLIPELRQAFLQHEEERETAKHLKDLARMYLSKEKREELAKADEKPAEDPQMARARNINHDLLKYANGLNGSFIGIIDSVAGYRAELAVTLQKLVESYNSILLQQFECFHTLKLGKENHLEEQIQLLMAKEAETVKERDNLKQKQELAERAIIAK